MESNMSMDSYSKVNMQTQGAKMGSILGQNEYAQAPSYNTYTHGKRQASQPPIADYYDNFGMADKLHTTSQPIQENCTIQNVKQMPNLGIDTTPKKGFRLYLPQNDED